LHPGYFNWGARGESQGWDKREKRKWEKGGVLWETGPRELPVATPCGGKKC